MGKFSESSYNILNEYFGTIKESSGEANSYLIGPRKTIVTKGGVVTHLYEKRSTGELIGYKFRITEISGNNFKFTYNGLLSDNSLSVGDFTVGNEMYFRKDAFFHDWLIVNKALYRDDVNTNKAYIYFGKIYEVPNELNTYSVVFEGMKDYMIKALPENNRTNKLEEFLKVYFDQVHHSVYNMTKNLWSLLDPKEINIRFLNLIALDYGIEIDEDLPESNLREWVDTIIYFLKRKGDYTSIYIIFKLLLSNTENKLNIYERWTEWCASELSDIPTFEDDHHILECYNKQAEGGAGNDYYSQYNPSNYPTYTDIAPSGECLKDIWLCGTSENYNTYSGVDVNNCLTIVDRNHLTVTNFTREDLYLSTASTTPSGDFLHCVKVTISNTSSAGFGLVIWGVANENGIWQDIALGSIFTVSLGFEDFAYRFRLMESWDDNNLQQWKYSTINYFKNTDYYLGIERADSELNLHIFDDVDRSNLLETVSLEISGDVPSLGSFDYLYALNTISASGDGSLSVDVYNLATGATSAKGINSTGNLILSPHYKVEIDLSSEPEGDNYIIDKYLMDELIRYWNYTKPISKYVHYEQLIAPTSKMNEIGEYVSLYDEHKNAYLNTQFTGTSFLSAAIPVAPSGTDAGTNTYTHKQTMSSYSWVINHKLETRDFVFQSYDRNNELIIPKEVEINTENRITLTFDNAVRGESYIAGIRNNYDYLHTELTQRTSPIISVNVVTEDIESITVSGNTFIDVDNVSTPYISYYDYVNDKVKYATKVSDVWVTTTVDDGGKNNVVKIDNLSISHIVYSYSNDDIVYANNSTGSFVPVIVGSDGKNGNLGLEIDSLNNSHVIYSAETPGGIGVLKHAVKSGGSWNYETIDTSPSGNYKDISVAIDSDNIDNLYISYVDDYVGELKLATGNTSSWSVTAANASGCSYTSLVLDSKNKVHIVYKNSSNEYEHITNSNNIFVKYSIDDTVGSNFKYTSLSIDDSDVLYTVYNSNNGTELRYGMFDTTAWTGWTNTLISQTPSATENMGFSVKVDEFNNIYSTYSEFTSASSAYLKYITLTSEVSGYTAFDWTINHNLATSGASGIIAQFYNNDYIKNMMVPVTQNSINDDSILASWNSADAYRGTSPVRRIDYSWDSTEGAANRWNFNDGDLEDWTSTNADIYATTNDTMRMIPTNWDYGETAEPEIRVVDLDFDGSNNVQVSARVKVRDASNAWTGSLYWRTSLHNESDLFYKDIRNEGNANYDWQVIEWNMSNTDDWISNNILGIRLDMQHDDYTYNNGLLLNTDNVSFEIDEPGRAYEEDGSFCRIEGIDLSSYTIPDNQAIKVTIDSSLIDETLTNFPVMVNISTSAGTGNYNTGKLFDILDTDDKRTKLKVTNLDGTVEYFSEIGEWSSAVFAAILWVKIPIISSTVDTEFLVSWNLSGSDGEHIGDIGSDVAKNVWSDNFTGVWHMGQNPSGGIILDSTTNELHGTPSAGADSSNYVDGLIGKAYLFTGVDDESIGFGIHDELIFGHDTYDDAFSIELLSKSESVSAGTKAVYEDSSYSFDARSPSGAHFQLNDVGGTASLNAYTATLSGYSGVWIHQIATYDGSSNDTGLKIYIDGTDATDSTNESGSYTAMDDKMTGDGFIIGHDMYGVEQTFDEIRIHSVERSAAWSKASTYSQYDALLRFEDSQQRRTHAIRLIDTTGLEASGWIGSLDDVETLGDSIEITSITKSASGDPGLMTVTGSAGLPSGALIKFNSLTEMTELNDGYSTVKPYSSTADVYGYWNEYTFKLETGEGVFSHMIYNNELYIGTGWTGSHLATAGRLLKWENNDWTELASTPTSADTDILYGVCAYNDKIYVSSNGALYEYDEAGGWIEKALKFYVPGVDYADLVLDLIVFEDKLFGCTHSIDYYNRGVLLRWNDVDTWELAADRYIVDGGYYSCQKIFIYNNELYGNIGNDTCKWDGVMGNAWVDTGDFFDPQGVIGNNLYWINETSIMVYDGINSSLLVSTTHGSSYGYELTAYNNNLYWVGWSDRLYEINLNTLEEYLVAYYDGMTGWLFNWNNSIYSLGYTENISSWQPPYKILDTNDYTAETTGGYCQQVINVGTDGIHVFSDSTTDDQSWTTIEDGFNWNDSFYTVLVTSTIVTGEFEFDWIMISNVPSDWIINHNLDAGGLIIECFDDVGDVISPQGITLTSPNSATVCFPSSTTGSANIIYLPKTWVIESNPDDIIGVGISENLGYWKIGNGTRQEYNPIGANDIQSITLSGSYDSVYENDSNTHYIIEFVISSTEDLTITEIGLFNEVGDIMFYTLCSPLFKPADINLRMFYRIEKNE